MWFVQLSITVLQTIALYFGIFFEEKKKRDALKLKIATAELRPHKQGSPVLERLPMQQRSAAASLRLHPVRRPDGRNKALRPPAFARLNADGKSFSVKICPTEMRHIEIKAHRIKTSATSADTVWGGEGGWRY